MWNEYAGKLENNYNVAEIRLRKLAKRFEKDRNFEENFSPIIQKQFLDGIVETVDLCYKNKDLKN